MSSFSRYLGSDDSGAKAATPRRHRMRVGATEGKEQPVAARPHPVSKRKAL